jgi:hypothetical protein
LLYKDITIENQKQFKNFYGMIKQGYNTMDGTGRYAKFIRFYLALRFQDQSKSILDFKGNL